MCVYVGISLCHHAKVSVDIFHEDVKTDFLQKSFSD